MSVELILTSWNDSESNHLDNRCALSSIILVEIITQSLYFSVDLGSLFYTQPAYESALKDIGTLYPCVRVRQNILYHPEKTYRRCVDLMSDSDHFLSSYFYHNSARWDSANVTAFIINKAGRVLADPRSAAVCHWCDCGSFAQETIHTHHM